MANGKQWRSISFIQFFQFHTPPTLQPPSEKKNNDEILVPLPAPPHIMLFLIFPGDISLHFPLTTEKTYTPPLGITLVPTEDGVFSSPGPGPICSTSEPFPANSSSLSSSVFSIVILLFRRKSHHTSKHGTTTTGAVRLPIIFPNIES